MNLWGSAPAFSKKDEAFATDFSGLLAENIFAEWDASQDVVEVWCHLLSFNDYLSINACHLTTSVARCR